MAENPKEKSKNKSTVIAVLLFLARQEGLDRPLTRTNGSPTKGHAFGARLTARR